MSAPDHYINLFLQLLHSMVPISPGFRMDMRPMMEIQSHSIKEPLLEISSYVQCAWFNVNAVIIAITEDEKFNEIVVRIITGESVFTDLRSFFQGKPSRLRFKVITEGTILMIKRNEFKKLKKYAETEELVQHIMLMENEIEVWRTRVMGMSDEQKIIEFAKKYPINRLPNNYCASFLQMTIPNYCTEKGLYNKRDRN